MTGTWKPGWLTRKKITAAGIAAVVLGTVIVSFNASTDGNNDRKVVAQFVDASPLLAGNDVRIGGVKVGKITTMAVADGKAQITMSLSAEAFPLHADARATIRPVSLLGERYVDLDRGSPSAPLLSAGRMLPTAQTAQSTDLDQVLSTIDDPTGQSLAALVTMLGQGADGNGANIAAAIKALGPAMSDTNKLAAILKQQNILLTGTLDGIEPVAAALASNKGKTLDALTEIATKLLETTATNSVALQQTLAQLPSTLSTARATLGALVGTAAATTPTLRAIRPVTDNLQQISQELLQFADAADPALASAAPVLKKARTLLAQAAPVISALKSAGPAVVSAAHSLRPIVGDLADNISNVLNFIKYWALATNGYDGLSHYFRGMLVVTPLSVTGLVPGATNLGIGGNPSVKPSAPAPPKALLPGLPGLLPGVLGGLLSPKPTSGGGVTGMTPAQEQGGLLALLGLGGI